VLPELEGYQDQLLSIQQDAPGIVAQLTPEQFNWRPAPARWSIAECFDHLNATARVFLAKIDRSIADAKARGLRGTGPAGHGLIDRLMIRAMEPPPRFHTRSPKVVTPAEHTTRDREAVMREFMEWQGQIAARVRQADGLALSRVRVPSPFGRWLTYSLGGAFAIALAHERRHLWQAKEVRNALERTKK
jgi:DinB superfamily